MGRLLLFLVFASPIIVVMGVLFLLRRLIRPDFLSSRQSVAMLFFLAYFILGASSGIGYYSTELGGLFVGSWLMLISFAFAIYSIKIKDEITREENILAYVVFLCIFVLSIIPQIRTLRAGGIEGGFGMDFYFGFPGLLALSVVWVIKSIPEKKYFNIIFFSTMPIIAAILSGFLMFRK